MYLMNKTLTQPFQQWVARFSTTAGSGVNVKQVRGRQEIQTTPFQQPFNNKWSVLNFLKFNFSLTEYELSRNKS